MYGIVGILSIAIQVYFAVHAYKAGRSGWIFIILFFPLVGSLVYFFVEFLPDLQSSQITSKITSDVGKIIDPKGEIKRLKDQLDFCDNVENRLELADAYINSSQFSEAIVLLDQCLKGHHSDDINILEKLAFSNFMLKQYDRAKECLFKIKDAQGKFESQEAHLLLAVCFECAGEVERALSEYQQVVARYIGEEARCRYAQLLKKNNRGEEAAAIFQEILKHAKVSPKFYQKEQAKWIDRAKKGLKDA